MLKGNGRLVHQSTTKHSYPFCWRSETPLIYKAVPSWFIRVEHMQEMLLKNNQETYWYACSSKLSLKQLIMLNAAKDWNLFAFVLRLPFTIYFQGSWIRKREAVCQLVARCKRLGHIEESLLGHAYASVDQWWWTRGGLCRLHWRTENTIRCWYHRPASRIVRICGIAIYVVSFQSCHWK